MNNFNNAVEEMYKFRKDFIIIGLTGRTGSGCSKVASILKSDLIELDLHTPKERDFNDTEDRKYQVVYNYMTKPNKWVPFTIIEGSSTIISFLLEEVNAYDNMINFIKEKHNSKDVIIDNMDKLESELGQIKDIFKYTKFSLKDIDVNNIDPKKIGDYYNYYISTLSNTKTELYKKLSNHICEIKSDDGKEIEKAQVYTYYMQLWANNIRMSGNPFDETNFTQTNYYDIAIRIDKIIHIVKAYKNNKDVRICIDALRSLYEVFYFRDNYKMFQLVSLTTDDDYRIRRLTHLHLSKEETDKLDSIEFPLEFKNTEEQFYHQNLQGCLETSDIHIYNPDSTDNKYYFLTEQILKYVALMLHPGIVTPTHMERCMQLAYNAKFNSGCLSRQVGAVITGDDYSVRAIGWNDVPKGQVACNLRDIKGYCKNKDFESYSEFERCDKDFSENLQVINNLIETERLFPYCFKDIYNGYKNKDNQVYTRSLHAEENAFLQLSKYGSSGIKGGFLFTTASPCELCAKKAYQLGITNIFYIDQYPGISTRHILTFGKEDNPKMHLFYGAIGNAYIYLYEPRIAMKDELELISGINCKKILKSMYKK